MVLREHEAHPDMSFQLRTTAQLFDLHCTVGLTDWDMDKELKLATTTDQVYHGDFVSVTALLSCFDGALALGTPCLHLHHAWSVSHTQTDTNVV